MNKITIKAYEQDVELDYQQINLEDLLEQFEHEVGSYYYQTNDHFLKTESESKLAAFKYFYHRTGRKHLILKIVDTDLLIDWYVAFDSSNGAKVIRRTNEGLNIICTQWLGSPEYQPDDNLERFLTELYEVVENVGGRGPCGPPSVEWRDFVEEFFKLETEIRMGHPSNVYKLVLESGMQGENM